MTTFVIIRMADQVDSRVWLVTALVDCPDRRQTQLSEQTYVRRAQMTDGVCGCAGPWGRSTVSAPRPPSLDDMEVTVSPRSCVFLAGSMATVLVGSDIALDVLNQPQIPIRTYIMLVAVCAVTASGGLQAHFRKGLQLGQLLRRIDRAHGREPDTGDVVVPMRKRG